MIRVSGSGSVTRVNDRVWLSLVRVTLLILKLAVMCLNHFCGVRVESESQSLRVRVI